MKTTHSIVLAALACAAVSQPALVAQKVGKHPPPTPRDTPVATPPQTSDAPNANAPSSGATYLYDQKPAPPPAPIVTPEQAKGIMDKFRASYESMGSPRLLLYINRELIDEKSGTKMVSRVEQSHTSVTQPGAENPNAPAKETQRNSIETRYGNENAPDRALADRQTVRDVERLFGRPFRLAGATLADQRLASQLIGDQPLQTLQTEGAQALKDRQALSQIADVVIEILVASKEVQISSFDNVSTYTMPDIQATAIRLKDARIVGQAATADLYGGEPNAAVARSSNVHSITEATALALMEDMIASFPPPPTPPTIP